MPQLFIAHSADDGRAAEALRQQLVQRGWPAADIVLDRDPAALAAQQRWGRTLTAAGGPELLICLASPDWLAATVPPAQLAALVGSLREPADTLPAAPADPAWLAPAAPPPAKRVRRGERDEPQRTAIDAYLATLPATAPLRQLLASQAFALRRDDYEAANAAAVRAQNRYKRWGSFALRLATLSTLIAALTLLPASESLGTDTQSVISGLQAAANIVALVVAWMLGRKKAVEAWLTSRATAEQLRGRLFADLVAAPAPPGADAAELWRHKLGLFRTAHVDYQRRYFGTKSGDHVRAATGLSLPRGLALLATGLSIVIGALAFLNLWPGGLLALEPWLKLASEPARWQLGLGTLASSLVAYAGARTLINQDERNAALYAQTLRALNRLILERDAAATAAAAAGDGGTVVDFARAAQAILDADYTAWQLHRPPDNPTSTLPEVKV